MEILREDIVKAARSFIGVRYLHQGRNVKTGVDCVGLLVLLGEKLGIEDIHDLPNYRRVPPASVLYDYLKRNLREIEVGKLKVGDFVLMRFAGGLKPRHTAIITNLDTELIAGIQPSMVHANGNAKSVVESPIKLFKTGFTNAFRIKGVK